MFGLAMLDVVIGVIFVFLLISIICSTIREGIEGWLKTRASHLEHGIRELLHDNDAKGLARHVFEHPLIFGLYSGGYQPPADGTLGALKRGHNLPSYIPSRNFALALMDIAARGPATDDTSSDPASGTLSLEEVRANIRHVGNPAVQRALLTAIDTAQGDLQKAVANVEAWYDSGMDRVSGWYKRSTQKILFCVGAVVAVTFNVNVIAVGQYLYTHEAERAALVAQAQSAAQNPAFTQSTYDEIRGKLAATELPIGWEQGWPHPTDKDGNPRPLTLTAFDLWNYVAIPILGWFITALAATFGAPFWFDLLNKVMVIRSTVKPHEKSPEESSEDRQTAGDRARAKPTADTGSSRAAGATSTPSQPGEGGAAAPLAPAPATVPTFARPVAQLPPDAVDGCDVEVTDFTADEDLPAAEGGVA